MSNDESRDVIRREIASSRSFAPRPQASLSWQANWQTEFDISSDRALLRLPSDPLTKTTRRIASAISAVLTIVLIPIAFVFGFVALFLVVITLGLFNMILGFLWFVTSYVLIRSSQVWVGFWPLRPLLFLPGLALSWWATALAVVFPCQNLEERMLRMEASRLWPASALFLEEYANAKSRYAG